MLSDYYRVCVLIINTKFDTHILYSSSKACIDPEVKGQVHTVMKTVTVVARLLVTRAAVVVCWCCRRRSACQYNCLFFLVSEKWMNLFFEFDTAAFDIFLWKRDRNPFLPVRFILLMEKTCQPWKTLIFVSHPNHHHLAHTKKWKWRRHTKMYTIIFNLKWNTCTEN